METRGTTADALAMDRQSFVCSFSNVQILVSLYETIDAANSFVRGIRNLWYW